MLLICQKMHLESLIITSIRDVTTAFTLFIKIGIWEISQIPKYLGNFPDTQLFGKFPRYPGIWEISGIWGLFIFKILEIPQMPGYLGNFPDTQTRCSKYLRVVFFLNSGNFWLDWIFGEFPKSLGIWEIFQKPRHLWNFSDTQAFGRFPRYPGIWEISQMPRHSGNLPETQEFVKFL